MNRAKAAGGLSHIRSSGELRMVPVGEKPVVERTAVARGEVRMAPATLRAIRSHSTPKGNPLETARLAGIMAAKRTAEIIPLCHTLPLDHVEVLMRLGRDRVTIEARVSCHGRTGVEMEALTAVSAAALALYDMCKAIDKQMVIADIRLLEKKKANEIVLANEKRKK
jgi:cyclic pyranopterin monophosphate synthase